VVQTAPCSSGRGYGSEAQTKKRRGSGGRRSPTRMAATVGLGGSGGLKTGEGRRRSSRRHGREAEGRKRDTHALVWGDNVQREWKGGAGHDGSL
jgi:hypothetical protein